MHFVRPAVGFVHLVDDHDGLQSQFDGLAQHKARLRHGAFKGIYQQQHAIGHFEHTLHFTAKISVARRVDQVDFDIFIIDRYVFRKNGDAPLPLQVVAVKDELARILARVECIAFVDDLVHEGGFAMIHMGDDGDISY